VKIALLVLGFRSPKVFGDIVLLMAKIEVDVYLHLDSKVDLNDYLVRSGSLTGNISVVRERYAINWGGYNMVRAEVALLRQAQRIRDYDRYVLISDDSFPLMNGFALRDEISRDYDRIDLNIMNKDHHTYFRYKNFFLFDHPSNDPRRNTLPRNCFIDQQFFEDVKKMEKAFKIGKALTRIYTGSQWWALRKDSVLTILEGFAKNVWLRDSFEYSLMSDEMAVHTFYVKGMEARGLEASEVLRNVRPSPMWADWASTPAPRTFSHFSELPGIFDPAKLFIRKLAEDANELREQLTER
jgi:hypothetical protein